MTGCEDPSATLGMTNMENCQLSIVNCQLTGGTPALPGWEKSGTTKGGKCGIVVVAQESKAQKDETEVSSFFVGERCGENPSVTALPCQPCRARAPFVRYADISPADGGINPLKGEPWVRRDVEKYGNGTIPSGPKGCSDTQSTTHALVPGAAGRAIGVELRNTCPRQVLSFLIRCAEHHATTWFGR